MGRGLPRYVTRDFARYLDCGQLANGFARVRCAGCGDELQVAFSRKGRGVCPSCNAKRAHGTAAHRVERVLPHVPWRQWTLSFPFGLRLALARDAGLLRRTFALDVFLCTRCGGKRRVLAYLTNPPVVRAILTHVGEPTQVGPLAAAQGPPGWA